MISIADDLLGDIDSVDIEEGGNSNELKSKIKNDDEGDLSTLSTLHLIDECLPLLVSEDFKKKSSSLEHNNNNVHAKVSSLNSAEVANNDPVIAQSEKKDDQLMAAAHKQLKRGRNRIYRPPEISKHHAPVSKEHKQLQQHDDSSQCSENDTRIEENGVDCIAYKCLEVFMNEVEEFYNTIEDASEISKHSIKFSNFVHEKYILLSLDLLPSSNRTVSKVRKLVTNFVSKCKTAPAETIEKLAAMNHKRKNHKRNVGTRKGWNCALCSTKNISLCIMKCDVCGRPRGFRPKDYSKDIVEMDPKREEALFLSLQNVHEKNAPTVLSNSERKRRHYLYSKRDFEIDSRLKLKSDASQLIESIRTFTSS